MHDSTGITAPQPRMRLPLASHCGKTLQYALTLETQHFHIIMLCKSYEELPLNIAPYEVGGSRSKEVIQALERGRALI